MDMYQLEFYVFLWNDVLPINAKLIFGIHMKFAIYLI